MEKGIAHRVLAKADDYLADLLVPRFKVDLDAEPSLEFANLMDADRKNFFLCMGVTKPI